VSDGQVREFREQRKQGLVEPGEADPPPRIRLRWHAARMPRPRRRYPTRRLEARFCRRRVPPPPAALPRHCGFAPQTPGRSPAPPRRPMRVSASQAVTLRRVKQIQPAAPGSETYLLHRTPCSDGDRGVTMLGIPGDRVSTPRCPSVPRKRNSVVRAGADAFRREAHSHFAVAHLEVQDVSAPASLEGPTMVAGLTMRSKSSAVMAPESRADSRRVRPVRSASWAMADALVVADDR